MRAAVLTLLLAVTACTPYPQDQVATFASQADLIQRVQSIEAASGGRLGVALYSSDDGSILSYRGDERFAMCSTFKLALAGMTLDTAGLRHARLDFGPEEILGYAPYARERAEIGWMSGLEAARHAVTISDNTAANLLLAELGGPEGFTRWLRGLGDEKTRLDRNEPMLNENAPGDPRDTTTPSAHAELVAAILWGDRLADADRAMLRDWLVETSTGARRLRAGLPPGWRAGDKTGTCGTGANGQVNDIAVFETPDGTRYVLAAYLDRPSGTAEEAEAMLAETARSIAKSLHQADA